MRRDRETKRTGAAIDLPTLTAKLPEVISFTSACNLAKAVDGVTIDHLGNLAKETPSMPTTKSEVR